MVCVQQAKPENTTAQHNTAADTITNTMEEEREVVSEEKNWLNTIDIESEHLQLRHLAGGNIVGYPPIFAENDSYIFLREEQCINIYSTVTGEQVRQLLDAPSKIVSMEFELNDPNVLVACTIKAEVLRWHWRTGQLQETKKLNLENDGQVLTFNLINFYHNSDRAAAFVCFKSNLYQWRYFLMDTSTGNAINIPCSMRIIARPSFVAVDNRNFHYLAIAVEGHVMFLNYKTWRYCVLNNSYKRKITALCVHPSEQCVATGDEYGQILLWRQFMDKTTVVTTLYHWHHTPITSIAFTEMGTSLYSSGHESVLVRWNVGKPEDRAFIPRMNSIIRHIAVQRGTSNVAVATDDNGVQFVDSNNKLQLTLQEFTYTLDDKTNLPKFPLGLKNNPRSNTLVFNGRIGHLQFYSTYSRSLLYNVNVVNQNILSMEKDQILYNLRVTKAAFNIDWMATGEVLNDYEHLSELRLKFWKYHEQKQCYQLNTNIEMPHIGGFRAIEFSNCNHVENLLCATVGEDDLIRIWALQHSDNIYRHGAMSWGCIAQTNYKNMPIQTIGFSQDGSLLAAGFGNTLCIYTADSLKLKAALNCAYGLDGCAQKSRITIAVPKPKSARKKNKPTAEPQRHRLLEVFQQILETSDNKQHTELFDELCSELDVAKDSSLTIKESTREMLFASIMRTPQLSLLQKLQLFQKLNIRCQVRPQQQAKLSQYISRSFSEKLVNNKMRALDAQLHQLSYTQRFKAKYLQRNYQAQQKFYDCNVTQQLVPLMSVLGLAETTTDATAAALATPPAKRLRKSSTVGTESDDTDSDDTNVPDELLSLPEPAQITHIQFAAGEYAYLVVVCTKTRVLIWNLLTFRVQAVLKISVEHLAFDPQTNLIAAYTHRHDLHIFQPNVPLPLYQRSALPKLAGLAWMPRRYPKATTINIDWQSQSTLFMLTEDQSIKYLGSSILQDDVPAVVSFKHAAPHQIQYTTFGTYATKQLIERQTTNQPIAQLIVGNAGKSVVKAITDMASHTMPPMSLLCGEFVRALVMMTAETERTAAKAKLTNGQPKLMNGHSHSDSETEDSGYLTTNTPSDKSAEHALEKRKTIIAKSEEMTKSQKARDKQEQQRIKEQRLQQLAKQTFDIQF